MGAMQVCVLETIFCYEAQFWYCDFTKQIDGYES
jgi:hypothetical protein